MPEEAVEQNPNEAFLEAYKNEKSPEQRLAIAEKFFLESSDQWIYLYSKFSTGLNLVVPLTASQIDERISQTTEQSQPHPQEAAEVKEAAVAPIVQASNLLDTFLVSQLVLQDYREKGKNVPLAEREHERYWQEFRAILEIGEGAPKEIEDILSWLRDKAEARNLLVIDSNNYEGDEKTQTLNIERGLGSPFSIRPDNYQLIIANDLLDPAYHPIEIVIAAAHERAHETLWRNDATLRVEESSKTVFSEFFAMMEEVRIFEQLPQDIKSKFQIEQALRHYTGQQEARRYEGTLAGLSLPLEATVDKATYMLSVAYFHGLESEKRNQFRETMQEIFALTQSGAYDTLSESKKAELMQALSPNVISTPVSGEVEWKQKP